MQAKIIIVGNITTTAERKQKKGSDTIYYLFTVAANKNKNEAVYYTCFAYGVSDERAKLLTTGTLIYLYGTPDEKIYTNPNTGEMEINRIVNIREFEILYFKKPD